MKLIIQYIVLFLVSTIYAQSNTDVFLFDIETKGRTFSITNSKNISNNEGYDNQPSFLDERYIIFSSERNGQTDIAKYDTRYGSKLWINFSGSSEYTPLKIPNRNAVSAVKLDKSGKQRLYEYSLRNGESTELIKDLVVAYYTWYNENNIVSAVIEGDDLNLYVTNFKEGWSKKYANNVGRSFHKIPNSNAVSYISKENKNQWQIKSLNLTTGSTKIIANTMQNVEDICWLNNNTILSGKDNVLYKLTLKKDNNWKKITDLKPHGISKITRLATNSTYTKLLVVGNQNSTENTSEEVEGNTKTNEPDTTTTDNSTESSKIEAIVQKQLEAYNTRNIDAFMATYSKTIKLYNYPNELRTEGQEQMRKSYTDWFKRTPDLRAFIKKRIVIGNKVIDEEQVTANGKIFNAVAIYEIENGLISKVTFIQ